MSTWYTEGLEGCLDGTIDLDTDTIKCLLLEAAHTEDSDDQFVTDIVANEASGTGYVRKTLTITVAREPTGNTVDIDATNPIWTSFTPDNAVQYLVIYKEVTNDTDNILILSTALASAVDPAGADLEWNFATPMADISA